MFFGMGNYNKEEEKEALVLFLPFPWEDVRLFLFRNRAVNPLLLYRPVRSEFFFRSYVTG